MITNCGDFDANVNKTDHICQIAYKTNNFDFSTTIIKVYDLVLYQMTKLTNQAYLFIVIHGWIRQIVACVFMLPFAFNTSLYDKNLRLFHVIARKVHDFDLIIAPVNAINTVNIITVQVDHSYVFLIMIV